MSRPLAGFLLSVVLAGLLAAWSPWSEPQPRHVFLIVIDTLRSDHLGSYGYSKPTSPTIDRVASRGVTFEKAFSTASATLESVLTLFTGSSEMSRVRSPLPTDALPLQQRFKQSGYTTFGVVSNPWLTTHPELFEHGFDHHWRQDDWEEAPNTTALVTGAAVGFVERDLKVGSKSFFYLHYLDPHDPYQPTQRHGLYQGELAIEPFDLHEASGEDVVQLAVSETSGFHALPQPEALSPELMEMIQSEYDEEIRQVDDGIRLFLEALERKGILDDSLLVITADHGEAFMEHGLLKHGFQLHDELLHVPLIFYWKGHLEPARRRDLVSGEDVPPTLLRLAGLSVPDYMQGVDLFGGSPRSEPIPIRTHFGGQDQEGIRTQRYKLIRNFKTGTVEIYDLHSDPEERHNVYDPTDPRWSKLLEQYYEVVERRFLGGAHGAPAMQPSIDEATRKQLAALGYATE